MLDFGLKLGCIGRVHSDQLVSATVGSGLQPVGGGEGQAERFWEGNGDRAEGAVGLSIERGIQICWVIGNCAADPVGIHTESY